MHLHLCPTSITVMVKYLSFVQLSAAAHALLPAAKPAHLIKSRQLSGRIVSAMHFSHCTTIYIAFYTLRYALYEHFSPCTKCNPLCTLPKDSCQKCNNMFGAECLIVKPVSNENGERFPNFS